MMSEWILLELFGALFIIIIGIYFYFKLIVFNFWRRKSVPYEEPTFPAGNITDAILNKKSIPEIFKEIYTKYKSYPFVGVYSFFKPILMINDPDLIRFVMTKEFSSFHDRGIYCNEKIDPLTGHLFLLPGTKWKNLRARLTPTFTSGKIKYMFETLQENGILLEKFLEKKVHERNEIDIKEIFAGFFTDIIMSTAFGINCNCLEHPESEFRYWGKKVFEPKPFINTMMVFASQIMEIFSIPLNDKGVSKFFLKVFEETVEYRNTHNITRRDFLNLIMQLMKDGYVKNDEEKQTDPVDNAPTKLEKFSMLEGAAQAFVFYVAGFETTSSTVTFCLYELALNQDIQKKTQEEIDRVIKKHGGISYNATNEMSYLHMVVCETLRKYPPVPILNRVCTKEIKLPNSNVIIPEGTGVVIPLFGIHRDPNIYPEPEKFIPERFSEEQSRGKHPYTYMPFGEGPRICIGMRFALVQTKVALMNALNKFTFLPGPNTPRKLEFTAGTITIDTKCGIYLQIQYEKYLIVMTMGWILSQLFGALFLIIIIIYLYFKLIAFNFWKKKGVPYEEPTFPAGNINDAIFNKKSIGVVFEDLYRKHKSLPYVGIYSLFKPNLMINDPDMIRFVMTKEFSSFHDRGIYCNEKIDPLSGHLFLLPGTKWRNLRVRLTPTFTSGKIKHMFETLQENGILLEKFLEKKVHERNEINIKEIFASFFTDIIMSTAFGINCNCLEHPESEFRYWGKKVFEPKAFINTMMIFAPQIMEIFSIPLNDKGVSKFFLKVFEETVEYRNTHNITRRDFLNLIIQLMKDGYVKNDEEKQTDPVDNAPTELEKFSMLEGAAQAFVFYVAGFETTSSTVTFCLYELALNPDIQKKTQEEIDRVIKKHGDISYNAINEMTYLHMVVCETLRKYPPVPILNRVCTKEIKLPNSNTIIPEGTAVVIPVLGLHRDPNIYPEPEKFIPERFSEEQIRDRHQYTYLPFGEGPRICIGMRFGLIQTKVALTNALKKFTFLPGTKTQRTLNFMPGVLTLDTKDGIYLQIQHRS
ncbi:uncharacterized protein LOC124951156 [Vespa velutina]|uniref:uncharacterized protein LOC124951156 n=1 Tax=Vespa velutina TaxID=202808 RepID=UPI001FB38B63|nr:uncharacterized protein LOC124951156 [Vespa velutina]